MKTALPITIGVLAAALSMGALGLREPAEPETTAPSVPSQPAAIADVAFLSGRWQARMGENRSGFAEETWSEPNGRNQIGMFRWNNANGESDVQELISITEEGGTLLLRLRHQNAAAIAWEEKDRPMVFVLVEKSPTLARFASLRDTGSVSGCRYERKGDKLFIEVRFAALSPEALASGKKQRENLHFELERVPLK